MGRRKTKVRTYWNLELFHLRSLFFVHYTTGKVTCCTLHKKSNNCTGWSRGGARSPPLFLDQTKGRTVENKTGSGWPPPPPPTSSQGLNPVALNCALYPDMISIVTRIQPRPPTIKRKTLGRRWLIITTPWMNQEREVQRLLQSWFRTTVLFFLKIFRLAIPALFLFTDVTELM